MRMPDFLIIGAAKAGTTSLWSYLDQHPQIYMSPVKETNFFALEGQRPEFVGPRDPINEWSVTDIEAYRALFAGASHDLAAGEASPLYLYDQRAPQRIAHYVPDVKLIAVLRNPVERAYSSFLFLMEYGREPLANFAAALQQEEARISSNWAYIWHYKQLGFYYTQLKRYFDLFDRQQIRVYLYEDFKRDNQSVLQDIFRFLGVDETFTPDVSARYWTSGIPKSKILHSFLLGQGRLKSVLRLVLPQTLRSSIFKQLKARNLSRPPLPSHVREQLLEAYRPDILGLQDLLQRDLSGWLK